MTQFLFILEISLDKAHAKNILPIDNDRGTWAYCGMCVGWWGGMILFRGSKFDFSKNTFGSTQTKFWLHYTSIMHWHTKKLGHTGAYATIWSQLRILPLILTEDFKTNTTQILFILVGWSMQAKFPGELILASPSHDMHDGRCRITKQPFPKYNLKSNTV
jgi:hypothetical protein